MTHSRREELWVGQCRTPGYPTTRLRRLRYHPAVRRLVQATRLEPSRWILPLFVHAKSDEKIPISSMPGQYQLSLSALREEVKEIGQLGLGGVLLFGIPAHKDPMGSDATSEHGIICQAIKVIKDAAPNLLVITDECFCEYTDHGHCGPLCHAGDEVTVDNDKTLRMLGWQAVAHARAGADMVAPSGMMDGMVFAIRTALDEAGFNHIPIMSYSAKYASSFYGPFREAAESAPQFGDRRSYQMDPSSAAEQAIREVELDVAEGADIIMVKPALAYLDVIRLVKESFPGLPLAAYNVSGEYSMVHAAAEKGWLDMRRIALEMLTAIHRAGADIVITYWAKQACRWIEADQ